MVKKIFLLIAASAIALGAMAQKKHPIYKNIAFEVNGCEIEMVYVNSGTFKIGCHPYMRAYGKTDEIPRHFVQLDGFYLGRYEVTQRLWKAIMGNNPSNFRGDDLPVEQVSYYDVQEFISRLNAITGKKFRLPTEAEWEYAAGGGEEIGQYYSGSNEASIAGWGTENSGDSTHTVGELIPNELGLYDMTGNVWEWCQDWYYDDEYTWRNLYKTNPPKPSWVKNKDDLKKWLNSSYPALGEQNTTMRQNVWIESYDPIVNPQGPAEGITRVGRGGSWCDIPEDMRITYRNSWNPNVKLSNLGFRLLLEYDPADTSLSSLWQQGTDSIDDGLPHVTPTMEAMMRMNQGALEGIFSVSPDKKVRFSKGNLQFNTAADMWRFAEHQTDFIGESNTKIKPGYRGWIDLFRWGTSGYLDMYPWKHFSNSAALVSGRDINIDGTRYDWGVHNSIQNGGNLPRLWRTLSVYEWHYLFSMRPNADKLHIQGRITVDTTRQSGFVEGYILFPDNWLELFSDTLSSKVVYEINAHQWSRLEHAGAVFLPAAGASYMDIYYPTEVNFEYEASIGIIEGIDYSFGQRIPLSAESASTPAGKVGNYDFEPLLSRNQIRPEMLAGITPISDDAINLTGYYWSTIHYNSYKAMALTFAIGSNTAIQAIEKLVKCSVRLVQDVQDTPTKSKSRKKNKKSKPENP